MSLGDKYCPDTPFLILSVSSAVKLSAVVAAPGCTLTPPVREYFVEFEATHPLIVTGK